MARMDLKLQRDAPGMSVFWMILILAAVTFLLLAIILLRSGGETEPVEAAGEQEIIAGEGDEVPGTTSFAEGEVAEEPQEPGDLQGEAGEVDEEVPPTGEADDSEEAGTVGAVDVDAAETEPDAAESGSEPSSADTTTDNAEESGSIEEEIDDEIVTDPDTDGSFDPTQSGPDGRDDEVITE